MRGFYCIQPKVWRGRNGAALRPVPPDPNDPKSPGYAERNRVTRTKLPGGIVRVDTGSAPGKRPKAAPPVPESAPPTPPEEAPATPPPTPPVERPKRSRMSAYGAAEN